ncbi:hypothetical protein [Staphylococcus lutrae]|uniref:Uncharacterized protein n=1 Tax=Staphylococcus lutrae TaxID=155085 RepID=A0AAC9RVN9_9STAP|nr:hypothetical protein [Staphylococcus lutrae]ARJ51790.1 hypothetical protein B5P37_10925 [Staphylococcus lutrae]PNZ35585.1 hypothetical protein CD134_09310 [Staphylococcus lutrae]
MRFLVDFAMHVSQPLQNAILQMTATKIPTLAKTTMMTIAHLTLKVELKSTTKNKGSMKFGDS